MKKEETKNNTNINQNQNLEKDEAKLKENLVAENKPEINQELKEENIKLTQEEKITL